MDLLPIKLAILAAAVGSAFWNAIMHSAADRRLMAALMTIPQIVIALPFLFYLPTPDSSVYWILFISACIHTGYIIFLGKTYQFSEFNEIYPVAIGIAPIINLLIVSILFSIKITWIAIAGVFLISASVAMFSLLKIRKKETPHHFRAILLALVTATFIAVYSTLDFYGIHHSASKFSYLTWLFILKGLLILVPTLLLQKIPFKQIKNEFRNFMMAGILSGVGYAVAMWAFYYLSSPIVLALRSTSIVFSIFMAVFLINESVKPSQYVFTFVIFVGIVLLVFTT